MSSIVDLVDAVAVDVVIEARSECADRARAQAALEGALAGARAPGRGRRAAWTVRLRVDGGAPGTRSGTATIVDDDGATVAERTVGDRTPRTCTSLARALGAWASLVLDDELARAHDPAPSRSAAPAEEERTAPLTGGHDSVWTARIEDHDVAPAPESGRPWTLELGLMAYLRDGLAATSGFAGGSPFIAVEVSPGWFVRPALAFGTSTAMVPLDATHRGSFAHFGFRGDFCRRIPGNYIERRGIELDVCAGGDLSHVYGQDSHDGVDPNAFRASVGPSAALRGELASATNVELRLAGGYNLARQPLYREEPPPMIYGAVEVGLSWRFR
jgi:hypothetical protein